MYEINIAFDNYIKLSKELTSIGVNIEQKPHFFSVIVEEKYNVNCRNLTITHLDTGEIVKRITIDDCVFYVKKQLNLNVPIKKEKDTLEFVNSFLNNLNLNFDVIEEYDYVNIYVGDLIFRYKYKTGKWGAVYPNKQKVGKYYGSKGIEDFYERFLLKNINEIIKKENETDYNVYLSDDIYGIDNCGIPVMFGRKINGHMSNSLWKQLGKDYELINTDKKTWFVVLSYLTREQAIYKYGKVTHDEYNHAGFWAYSIFDNQIMLDIHTINPEFKNYKKLTKTDFEPPFSVREILLSKTNESYFNRHRKKYEISH